MRDLKLLGGVFGGSWGGNGGLWGVGGDLKFLAGILYGILGSLLQPPPPYFPPIKSHWDPGNLVMNPTGAALSPLPKLKPPF